MRAVLNGEDGHLHWTEVPDPQIKEDEVLLEVEAAALNRADLLQRAGQYPPPPGWPNWFGLEAIPIYGRGTQIRRNAFNHSRGKWIGERNDSYGESIWGKSAYYCSK